MGQQQLLLVILVTIIVGIATVVAINVFGTSAKSANEDAVRQDVLSIASASQGWYIKPEMMGGGGNSFEGMTFYDFNFSADSISSDSLKASNMNGSYHLVGTDQSDAQTFTVEAYPSSADAYDPANIFAGNGTPMEATVSKGDVSWD